MTNYRKLYGITLKQAKQIVLARNGHLPHVGYETYVTHDTVKIKHDFPPRIDNTLYNHERTIYLANHTKVLLQKNCSHTMTSEVL